MINSKTLTKVWQEVSHHVEIQEAVDEIASLLTPLLPSHRFQVYRYTEAAQTMELVADGGRAIDARSDIEQFSVSSALRGVLNGGRADPRTHASRLIDSQPLRALGLMHEHSIAAVLADGGGLLGMALLHAEGPTGTENQSAIFCDLLDPLAVALHNDNRIHELERLRKVAEAEREAPLRRLARDPLTNEVIGAHSGLRFVMERIDRVARTDLPVLLLGETGTGKEMIAWLIHERSKRRNGPFLRVNSGAIPPDLLDAELFGHEKGAFTGAVATRRGWFERADGGTLLLDEVGELTPAAQVRLLRVLQEHSFERVGGEKTVQVNVRVVVATHRDLPSMVRQGTFRQDLWYRLSSFPLLLPALRERKQDIPDLVQHFAKRAARMFSMKSMEPTPEDLALLCAYDWPGNIRELASVIDRAAILGNGACLAIRQALGTGLAVAGAPIHASPLATVDAPSTETAALDSLDAAMRKHIEAALSVARGQIEGKQGAAGLLDINPHTLRARMRKLGINPTAFRP